MDKFWIQGILPISLKGLKGFIVSAVKTVIWYRPEGPICETYMQILFKTCFHIVFNKIQGK
jgi:hypothetical protein